MNKWRIGDGGEVSVENLGKHKRMEKETIVVVPTLDKE